MTQKTKDELIAEATALGLSDGQDLVGMTKAQIQELIDQKVAETNPLLDGPADEPAAEVTPEPEAPAAEITPAPSEVTPEQPPVQDEPPAEPPLPTPEPEVDPAERIINLEIENQALKAELEYATKIAIETQGKDRLTRLQMVKDKLEGQIKGYYKMSIFDMQELLSLI